MKRREKKSDSVKEQKDKMVQYRFAHIFRKRKNICIYNRQLFGHMGDLSDKLCGNIMSQNNPSEKRKERDLSC